MKFQKLARARVVGRVRSVGVRSMVVGSQVLEQLDSWVPTLAPQYAQSPFLSHLAIAVGRGFGGAITSGPSLSRVGHLWHRKGERTRGSNLSQEIRPTLGGQKSAKTCFLWGCLISGAEAFVGGRKGKKWG